MSQPVLVDDPRRAQELLQEIGASRRVAIDVESNGMYVYRPQLCMVQAAWERPDGEVRVALLDTLAIAPGTLAPLAADQAVTKVIHDLAFDARMLRRDGIRLDNVRDTSVAASYLGIGATGLASLLSAEFGVVVDKKMQTADWGRRPVDAESAAYLAGDVKHLLALHDRLWERVERADIVDEVETETAYRLARALDDDENGAPPWVRIRGTDRLDDMGRAVLRELADGRERLAAQRNLPLYRVVGDKQLLALARARPRFEQGIRRVMASGRGGRDAELVRMIDEAIARGTAAGALDADDAAWLKTDRLDRETAQRRKSIEGRLSHWRKAEAARRRVTDQVVLPSHCLKHVVTRELHEPDEVAVVPGMGTSRAALYAAHIARIVDDVVRGRP